MNRALPSFAQSPSLLGGKLCVCAVAWALLLLRLEAQTWSPPNGFDLVWADSFGSGAWNNPSQSEAVWEAAVNVDWNNSLSPASKGGILNFTATNINRVIDPAAPGGALLNLKYPATSYAPSGYPTYPRGGSQWYGPGILATQGAGHTVTHAFLEFWVRFPNGFDFVKGGKLPGLYGGTGNLGDDFPNGNDGWSTRFMFRADLDGDTDGNGEVFAFLPDSPVSNKGWSLGRGNWEFQSDEQWHQIVQEVILNTPGTAIHDGVVRAYYDGALVYDSGATLWYRDSASLFIDGLVFQTFFGGGDPTWASPTDQSADFSNFRLYIPRPISGPTLISATVTLPLGIVGSSYASALSVVNGSGLYTFGIASGTLPSGLILNSNTGALSGTPTAVGSASLTFKATSSTNAAVFFPTTLIVANGGATSACCPQIAVTVP